MWDSLVVSLVILAIQVVLIPFVAKYFNFLDKPKPIAISGFIAAICIFNLVVLFGLVSGDIEAIREENRVDKNEMEKRFQIDREKTKSEQGWILGRNEVMENEFRVKYETSQQKITGLEKSLTAYKEDTSRRELVLKQEHTREIAKVESNYEKKLLDLKQDTMQKQKLAIAQVKGEIEKEYEKKESVFNEKIKEMIARQNKLQKNLVKNNDLFSEPNFSTAEIFLNMSGVGTPGYSPATFTYRDKTGYESTFQVDHGRSYRISVAKKFTLEVIWKGRSNSAEYSATEDEVKIVGYYKDGRVKLRLRN